MSVLVVVTDAERVAVLLRWSKRIAQIRRMPITVLCFSYLANGVKDNDAQIVKATREAADEIGGIEVEQNFQCQSIKEIITEINLRAPDLVILGIDGMIPPESLPANLADCLMKKAKYDVLLLDPGESEGLQYNRVVVPMEMRLSNFVLRRLMKNADMDSTIVPLLVAAEFSEDSRELAKRELNLRIQETGVNLSNKKLKPRIVLADSQTEGILAAIDDCDLLLIGSRTIRPLRELRLQAKVSANGQAGMKIPIAVFYPYEARSTSILSILDVRVRTLLPELTLTDRIMLFDRIQVGARLHADFSIMIAISVGIATLGLLNDSSAVVIGAMLVAPLMTPLIGAGLALAQGNLKLFRRSLIALGVGVLIGFLLSFGITLFVPGDHLSIQVISRGLPNVLDLFIALFSGMAAAYAFSRVSVAEALVGVAIAAALVPPLASIGICLAYRDFSLAGGAVIMLITNLAAIILGASWIFRILRVQGTRIVTKHMTWAKRTVLLLILIIIFLLGPLGYHHVEQMRTGQIRPMAFPITSKLSDAIDDRLALEPDVTRIMAGRSGTKRTKIGILLASKGPVSNKLITDLDILVHKIRGREVQVRIWVVQQATVTNNNILQEQK